LAGEIDKDDEAEDDDADDDDDDTHTKEEKYRHRLPHRGSWMLQVPYSLQIP
jgi:hypothetical protein